MTRVNNYGVNTSLEKDVVVVKELKVGDDRDDVLVVKRNELTGNITRIMPVTQAQYDALSPVDAETLYVIVEAA